MRDTEKLKDASPSGSLESIRADLAEKGFVVGEDGALFKAGA